MPVRGHRARYFELGLAPLQAQIRLEREDFRPNPSKFPGPFLLSRGGHRSGYFLRCFRRFWEPALTDHEEFQPLKLIRALDECPRLVVS